MHKILTLSSNEQLAIRSRARKLASERFSEDEFVEGVKGGWNSFLKKRIGNQTPTAK